MNCGSFQVLTVIHNKIHKWRSAALLFPLGPHDVEVKKALTTSALSHFRIQGNRRGLSPVSELWKLLCDLPQSKKVNDLLTQAPG